MVENHKQKNLTDQPTKNTPEEQKKQEMKNTSVSVNKKSGTMTTKINPLNVKRIVILAIIQLSFVFGLHAAWVERMPTTITDPDGTEHKVFSTGDEFFSFLHDEEGYTIIKGDDGYYYFAAKQGEEIVPSAHKIRNTNPKQHNIQPNIRISEQEYKNRRQAMWKDIPENPVKSVHQGTMVNLVVYIRFADDTEFALPRSTYDARFNGADQQSIKDYFQEVSYNNLTIQSYHYPESEMTVNISYQDQYPRGYYKPYNATSNPIGYTGGNSGAQRVDREHTLLMNAVNAVSSQIPTSLNIDANNDNRVDNVCFVIRGNAEGWADLLWAHRWVLYSKTVNINGKRVWDYTFQPENQATVKILAHEMFHTLGAPDLYHYSYDGLNPTGDWDLMHSGFGHMGAYMKWKYAGMKWVTSIPVISQPGTYTLNPITSPTQNAFRINSPNSTTEYFVVEYRKKEGRYETNIPGTGLLVYRINTSAGNGNAQGPPDEVYIYRPNGTPTVNGNITTAHFNASLNRTTINDQTNPSSFLTNGSAGGLNISNVTAAGNTISFDLNGGSTATVNNPQSFTAAASGTSQINLAWQKNAANNNVMVAVNTSNTFGNPSGSYTAGNSISGGGTVLYTGNATSFSHTGLTAATTYFYKIWSVDGTTYSTGLSTSASTQANQFTVSVSASPSNAGSVNGGGTYNQGTQATVQATSNAGYSFASWKEGTTTVSTNSNYTFTVNANRTLVANFQIIQYTISASASPTAGGSITGAGSYNHGAQVSLTATANTGYIFVNWKEGSTVVSTNPTYAFTASANRTLTATFSQQQYTIAASATPSQGGTVSGAGTYNHGAQVSLTATANAGYTFVNWKEGSTVVSTEASYSFTATANRTLTANFSQLQYTITAVANPTAGGTISGAGTYNHGAQVSLAATPSSGYFFVNWKEGSTVVSTNATYTFTANATRNLTATFSQQQYAISTNASPSEGGSTTGAGSYGHGAQVTLLASANAGYSFVNWTEGATVVSSNASYSFVATANRNLTANFSQQQYTIAANANPAQGGSLSGAGTYTHGQQVSMVATANSGYAFVDWKEGSTVVSTNPAYSFTANANRNLTATFSLLQYTIAAGATPAQGGNVSGAGTYNHGAQASLTASPNAGWNFISWEEDGTVVSTSPVYEFLVTSNRSINATFSQNQYGINLTAIPSTGGSLSGGGAYNYGQTATASAQPNEGWDFVSWSENGSVVSEEANYSFTVTNNRNLVATFSQVLYQVILTASPSEGGTVSGEGYYGKFSQVTVWAAPNNGWNFLYWTEDGTVVSTNLSYSFPLSSDKHLTAHFAPQEVLITADVNEYMAGMVSGSGIYYYGDEVVMEATAMSGYTFAFWKENSQVVSTQTVYQFTAETNRNLTAVFQSTSNVYYTMNISSIGNGYTNPPASQYTHAMGSVLILEAHPASGWVFEKWEINGEKEKEQFIQITVGENMNIQAFFVMATSIENEAANQEVTLYPNPAASFINLSLNDFNGFTTVEILNLQGQSILKTEIEDYSHSQNLQLDVANFKPGIYLVSIYNEGKLTTRKFTKH